MLHAPADWLVTRYGCCHPPCSVHYFNIGVDKSNEAIIFIWSLLVLFIDPPWFGNEAICIQVAFFRIGMSF